MWWWRTVRRANIPAGERDLFDRFGKNVIAMCLSGGFAPQAHELQQLVHNVESLNYARDWLTEQGDLEARHEDRLETVEWAILIFVVIGVILDAKMIWF